MVLFLIAVVALAMKAANLARQSRTLRHKLLEAPIQGGQSIDVCRELLRKLPGTDHPLSSTYLVARLRAALVFVQRREAIELLDDELKSLAARDRRQMFASYWQIGLVLGLLPLASAASALSLASQASVELAIESLQWSLGFVGTLLVIQFAVLRCDCLLLRSVDKRVDEELLNRFQRLSAVSDPQVLAVRRMADAVVQVTDRLVQRQVELWQSTIEAAQAQWDHRAGMSLEQTEATIERVLERYSAELAARLAATELNGRDPRFLTDDSPDSPAIISIGSARDQRSHRRFNRAENKAA
jgi:hypothetical protein